MSAQYGLIPKTMASYNASLCSLPIPAIHGFSADPLVFIISRTRQLPSSWSSSSSKSSTDRRSNAFSPPYPLCSHFRSVLSYEVADRNGGPAVTWIIFSQRQDNERGGPPRIRDTGRPRTLREQLETQRLEYRVPVAASPSWSALFVRPPVCHLL